MSAFTTQHENGVAVITFDLPGEPVNKLTAAVRVELEALLIGLRDATATRAVVLISGKPDNFIAGADIEEFTALTSQDAAERLSFEEAASIPTVFLTAWYSLMRLAGLRKGERVLIHAATGDYPPNERRSLWRATIMERNWEAADAAARAALN